MIIIPSEPRSKLLLPMRRLEWDQPSAHGYGIPNQTRFRLTARANDGAIIWRGWFDDRDDADTFLWALLLDRLKWDQELWRLPTPEWYPMYPGLTYDFATVTFFTSPVGSWASWSTPADFNHTNNTMECVGGGGHGYSGQGVAYGGVGGGGGAYAGSYNQSLLGYSPWYVVADAVQSSYWGSPDQNGNNAIIYAQGGSSGYQVYYGVSGGAAASSKGYLRYDGGSSNSSYYGASGGGGAAGPQGAGGQGGYSISAYASSGGGGGGANAGAAGSPGGQGAAGGNGGNNRFGTGAGTSGASGFNGGGGGGGAGYGYGQAAVHAGFGGSNDQCWDPTHGCGGGSGGGGDGGDGSGIVGGYGYNGGLYGGGGGGGGAGTYSGSLGYGVQGIIVVTYTPLALVSGFNMPMMGM